MTQSGRRTQSRNTEELVGPSHRSRDNTHPPISRRTQDLGAAGESGLAERQPLQEPEHAERANDVGRNQFRPPRPHDADQADYLLSPFSASETMTLRELMPTLTAAVDCWVREGVELTMNRYNRRGNAE